MNLGLLLVEVTARPCDACFSLCDTSMDFFCNEVVPVLITWQDFDLFVFNRGM